MISIMTNNKEREILAKMAIKNVQRFKLEQIAQKWKQLFEKL